MNQTFILQNQDKLFWGKAKEWVGGYDANSLFKTPHKDEAVNQLVEVSSKDFRQRIKIIECAVDEKSLPIIDSDIMPAPLPKAAKPLKVSDDLFAVKPAIDEESANEELSDEEELIFSETDELASGELNNDANNFQANLM